MKWINPLVNVLYTISATVGQGVGMVLPSANVVFAGIGVLLVVRLSVFLFIDPSSFNADVL
jgi:hypothetical protein